jgi:dUTP pyrophosphatase
LPDRVEVAPDRDGYYELPPGGYVVLLNEVVNLPTDLMAFGRPRSSLLRCGVALHTAVWDAGYSGRSESLLIVYNPAGVRLRRDARILQLVFCALDRPTEPYAGRFQNENLG